MAVSLVEPSSAPAEPEPLSVADLTLERFSTVEAMRALAPEWRKLFVESDSELPFYSYEWADCWWEHLHEERSTIGDVLDGRVLRGRGGELVGIAPMMRTERP